MERIIKLFFFHTLNIGDTMKNKLISLMIVLVSILSINIIKASTTSRNLIGKVIYLDPGHGGVDPGAIYKDIYESNINLSIAKKLEKVLGENGAIVYLTRDGNYDLSLPNAIYRKRSDLSRRANIINESNCDLYISIHLNSESTGIWKGAQVFYDDINPENQKIAKIFQEAFVNNLNSNREYKEINDMYLHKRVERPGVLVEVGFLSNVSDRNLLISDVYQEKVANTILDAIYEYFK